MSDKKKGLFFVLTGILLMSLDPVFIRMSGASGWDTAFLFGLFTFFSMSVLTQAKEKGGIKGAVFSGGLPIIISGLVMGGSGTTLVLAVKHTLVANAVLIMSVSPVFAAIYSRILLKEKASPRILISMAAAMGGIFVITADSLGTGGMFGNVMAIVCASFSALNYVIWRKYPHISRTMVIALGGFSIAGISFYAAEPSELNMRTWLVMAAMGLLSAPVGRVFMSTAARYITAMEISLFSLSRTFLAPLMIWLIYAEMPGLSTFTGGVIILAALIFQSFSYDGSPSPKSLKTPAESGV
ncbi:hypothetical protein ADMFC3_11460 [Geovibrio sp. ADMFC3]